MKTIKVLEYGRINWKGEYVVVQYVPLKNFKAGELLAKEALKEYKDRDNFKVRKKAKRLWEIEETCPATKMKSYYYIYVTEKNILDEENILDMLDKIDKSPKVYDWLKERTFYIENI